MSKVKIEMPDFRGSARACPTCEGIPAARQFNQKKCPTCFGSGVVHEGKFCLFCGRSVQIEYKGYLICGTSVCETEADKELTKPKGVVFEDDRSLDYYDRLAARGYLM